MICKEVSVSKRVGILTGGGEMNDDLILLDCNIHLVAFLPNPRATPVISLP